MNMVSTSRKQLSTSGAFMDDVTAMAAQLAHAADELPAAVAK